jgi:hypothetical protein
MLIDVRNKTDISTDNIDFFIVVLFYVLIKVLFLEWQIYIAMPIISAKI